MHSIPDSVFYGAVVLFTSIFFLIGLYSGFLVGLGISRGKKEKKEE